MFKQVDHIPLQDLLADLLDERLAARLDGDLVHSGVGSWEENAVGIQDRKTVELLRLEAN